MAYTCTGVPKKIKLLFEKVRHAGVPPKVDLKWLQANGFRSSSDRTLISVLKAIDFLDGSNAPTNRWWGYRAEDGAKQLAEGIRAHYKPLFDNYPDANQRSDKDLEHFFRANSDAGHQVVIKTVSTFKALCDLADFTGDSASSAGTELGMADSKVVAASPSSVTPCNPSGGTTININIQLTIPESADPKVYESFFAAMKKHLWS